jgi:hypothetical protein
MFSEMLGNENVNFKNHYQQRFGNRLAEPDCDRLYGLHPWCDWVEIERNI